MAQDFGLEAGHGLATGLVCHHVYNSMMEHRSLLHSRGLALQVSNIRQDLGSAHRFYDSFGRI